MKKTLFLFCLSIAGSAYAQLSVGNNGLLDVKAMDAIVIKPGFSVNSGATVILECDGNITVGACVVKSGGTLILKGDNIHLSAGFKVEKGAKFEIKNI